MKLKTFLATYALFLLIFFLSQAVVSVHMTNNQFAVLREKAEAEFGTIAASLAKDIAVLSGRELDGPDFEEQVQRLVAGYERYYQGNRITLALTKASGEAPDAAATLSFASEGGRHSIHILGALSGHFQYYRLAYASDISQNVAELTRVQTILILLIVIFSGVAAVALQVILSRIFKPLDIVSQASRKIADGRYDERIDLKGRSELSAMAENFNRMAAEIEKQIRLLEEEAAEKQRFVDNFAHEIRTPLTSIYGYAEYLQKARLGEGEVLESAQFILREAGYMRKLADSLLALAELRQSAVCKSEVSLPRLLEGVSQSLRGILPEKRVRIVCDGGAERVRGQEDLLRSLLLNLGVNAIRACPERGGTVRMEAREEGDRVVLSVSDNGRGIPPESLAKVTEPFYRVDKARSRETGGVGLGLALCCQIAASHGAELRIASEPGAGTRVDVIFTTP